MPDGHVRGGQMPGSAGSLVKALSGRVAVVTRDDPLRYIVEKLSVPGVRRLVVVERHSRRVEGIVSLSDVAAYLFL